MDQQKRDQLGIDLARQQTKLVRELKTIRVSSGLTVAEVASSMSVDEAVVYRFEKGGTNPTLATVRRYALAVGAMLDLGATTAFEHTSKAVQRAADSIEHDPVELAGPR
ncbi:helix-turn-helix domain-containing protein [Rhodococcus sp. NPDC058521]|uniref:helix-turn-helix domain-containing protein n=1 Tax=Rhodococcus sp. NPDC058521 TaxID=3346536 RepID=UPI003666D55C